MRMKRLSVFVVVVGLALATVACGGQGSSEAAPAAAPAPAQPAPAAPEPVAAAPTATPADAKKTFTERCAVCHGDGGKGDGVGAASLNPKPRDFGDAAWHGTVTDEHIEKVITGGGASVGKSPIMPAHADLKKNDALLKELVKYVRAFKG